MGSHPDHALHKVFHQWRKRAREAEAKLARIETLMQHHHYPTDGRPYGTADNIKLILDEGKETKHDQC